MNEFSNEQIYKLLEDSNQLFEHYTTNQVCSFDYENDFYVVVYIAQTNTFIAMAIIDFANNKSDLEELIFKVQNIGAKNNLRVDEVIKNIEYLLNKSKQHFYDAH